MHDILGHGPDLLLGLGVLLRVLGVRLESGPQLGQAVAVKGALLFRQHRDPEHMLGLDHLHGAHWAAAMVDAPGAHLLHTDCVTVPKITRVASRRRRYIYVVALELRTGMRV